MHWRSCHVGKSVTGRWLYYRYITIGCSVIHLYLFYSELITSKSIFSGYCLVLTFYTAQPRVEYLFIYVIYFIQF